MPNIWTAPHPPDSSEPIGRTSVVRFKERLGFIVMSTQELVRHNFSRLGVQDCACRNWLPMVCR